MNISTSLTSLFLCSSLLFAACSDSAPKAKSSTETGGGTEPMNQDSVLHGFTTFPKPDIQILGLDGDSSVQDAKQIKIALKVAAEAFDNKCLALGIARSGERFFNGRGIDISLDFSRPIDFGDMRQVRGFHCHTSVVEMAVLSRGDKRYEVPVRSHSGSQSAGLTNPEILEKVVGTSIETQVHRLWEKVQQAGAP